MWNQWLLKSGGGTMPVEVRGPAPPAAVATAAKIAFSALGSLPAEVFRKELHTKAPEEQLPVDTAAVALLEKSPSGTMRVPLFSESMGEVCEWIDARTAAGTTSESTSPTVPSVVCSPLVYIERRNRNSQWLKLHFRTLIDIGRLPFNNADLWQLHQFYFSPSYAADSETEAIRTLDSCRVDAIETAAPIFESETVSGVSRAISFQTLGDALTASFVGRNGSSCKNKREIDDVPCDHKQAAKRPKNLKPRIENYPRIMVR
jgi:hypothetical protein